jgi:hypothetical protein
MAAEVIVFADVEDLVRQYLQAELATRPGQTTTKAFAGQLPATLPAKSVLVTRTGGVTQDLVVDMAQVTIECRAASAGTAERLAALVRGLIGAAERDGHMLDVPIYEVREFSAPYSDPDPRNAAVYRYSATYQVAVRGTVE